MSKKYNNVASLTDKTLIIFLHKKKDIFYAKVSEFLLSPRTKMDDQTVRRRRTIVDEGRARDARFLAEEEEFKIKMRRSSRCYLNRMNTVHLN